MTCTRCEGTGFLNLELLDDDVISNDYDVEQILKWIEANPETDVSVCDCCGDTESWYGEPGSHYGADDPSGKGGPYEYNGGLCECD